MEEFKWDIKVMWSDVKRWSNTVYAAAPSTSLRLVPLPRFAVEEQERHDRG